METTRRKSKPQTDELHEQWREQYLERERKRREAVESIFARIRNVIHPPRLLSKNLERSLETHTLASRPAHATRYHIGAGYTVWDYPEEVLQDMAEAIADRDVYDLEERDYDFEREWEEQNLDHHPLIDDEEEAPRKRCYYCGTTILAIGTAPRDSLICARCSLFRNPPQDVR